MVLEISNYNNYPIDSNTNYLHYNLHNLKKNYNFFEKVQINRHFIICKYYFNFFSIKLFFIILSERNYKEINIFFSQSSQSSVHF